MARLPRFILPGQPQHIIQRGNNRQATFCAKRDYHFYLKCGRLEHGFLRVRCENCHKEHLVAISCKRRGLLRAPCPSPFGPACGSSKSLPAILSAPVEVHVAWPRAQPWR